MNSKVGIDNELPIDVTIAVSILAYFSDLLSKARHIILWKARPNHNKCDLISKDIKKSLEHLKSKF